MFIQEPGAASACVWLLLRPRRGQSSSAGLSAPPQEFIRVGYYVNSEYTEEELRENPPEVIDITKVGRNILSDKPRVTRFQVEFDQPMVRAGGSRCSFDTSMSALPASES